MTIFYCPFLQPPDFNKIWKEFGRMFGDYQNLEPHTLTDVSHGNRTCHIMV